MAPDVTSLPIDGWSYEDMMSLCLKRFAHLQDDVHGADTPKRFLESLFELTQCGGLEDDHEHELECIKWKAFPAESKDMIVLADIPFVSLCNHHLSIFHGKAFVGYVPENEMAGLSKFARTVKHFARQLQVQERMTAQIAAYLEDKLKPKGIAVLLQAEHTCMTIRGAKAHGTFTTTSSMRGVFSDHDRTAKSEFMQIIGGSLR